MGWLPQSVFNTKRELALALSKEQRENLTWELARAFVVADTLELAKWSSLEKQKDTYTPWQAVCKLRGIKEGTQC